MVRSWHISWALHAVVIADRLLFWDNWGVFQYYKQLGLHANDWRMNGGNYTRKIEEE
jgi:hypothetical protein